MTELPSIIAMKRGVSVLLLLFFSSATAVVAQEYKNEFGFKSDNDAYLGQGSDRYYTNGLFITFRHALKQDGSAVVLKKIWEAEVGQRMYNPQSGYVPDITYVDRPFAAYLYAGGAMNFFYKNDHTLKISLQGGVVGPSAIGRQTQELLHRVIGFYTPNGWQFQVKDELQLNSAATYRRVLARSNRTGDLSFEGTVNAGTTFSGAAAAGLFRMGSLNAFSRSVSANSRIANGTDSAAHREFFFFARPKLSYIAYDATVQGGLFRKDKGPVTYDVKPIVFTQEAGFMFAAKRWTADFSVLFLTKEIQSSARAHQWGSVELYYRW